MSWNDYTPQDKADMVAEAFRRLARFAHVVETSYSLGEEVIRMGDDRPTQWVAMLSTKEGLEGPMDIVHVDDLPTRAVAGVIRVYLVQDDCRYTGHRYEEDPLEENTSVCEGCGIIVKWKKGEEDNGDETQSSSGESSIHPIGPIPA